MTLTSCSHNLQLITLMVGSLGSKFFIFFELSHKNVSFKLNFFNKQCLDNLHSHVFRQFADFFPPGITTVHFCDHVFRTLDTDGNGFLDFKVWNKYFWGKKNKFSLKPKIDNILIGFQFSFQDKNISFYPHQIGWDDNPLLMIDRPLRKREVFYLIYFYLT